MDIRDSSCGLRDTQDNHHWYVQMLLLDSLEGPGLPGIKGFCLPHTCSSGFLATSGVTRGSPCAIPLSVTMLGLGLLSRFPHPQLSSPLLLFSSLVKHVLYLLAPGPKALLLALASLLGFFKHKLRQMHYCKCLVTSLLLSSF